MLVDINIIMRLHEKSADQVSINRGRKTTTEGAYASLMGVLYFVLFLSW